MQSGYSECPVKGLDGQCSQWAGQMVIRAVSVSFSRGLCT